MTISFYSIPTNIGATKLANAIATNTPLNLTEMAVGDGGGVYVEPDPTQTALVNECYRTTINSMTINTDDSQQLIVEMIIPEDVGGFTEREIGIFDEDGDLIIVANCGAIEKTLPNSGSPSSQVIRLPIEISSAAAVNIIIDPSAVIVTQEYADSTYLKINNNLSEIAAAGAEAQGISRGSLGLGDSATLNVGTGAGTVAAGDDSRITGALQKDNNLSEIAAAGAEAQTESRENIGCGTAAALAATTSVLDATVGRALRVGDFGVGGQTFGVLADNVNVRDRAAYGVNFSRVMNPPDVPSLSSYYNLIMLPETLGGAFSALALPENNSPVYRFFGSGSGGTIAQAKIYDELNRPNAVDVGALPISGGELTGPLTVDSTVSVVADQIYVRDAVYQDNGDICGLEWGNDGGATPGWLSIYLSGQFNRFIELLQLGAAVQVTTWNASGTWPNIPGCVITNVFKDGTDGNLDGIYYAPLQAFKNGSWYTISGGNL
ncbi:phage tail protein [Salmonella enterica]|nr:phage tail protein [Salmonella enterica]EEA2271402.1 hypothetical protein [Salmonella enterica]EFV5114807.1 phage tail protein [Salmonella enterica]EKL9523963.1 phage tail protein [Salmonella enterica]